MQIGLISPTSRDGPSQMALTRDGLNGIHLFTRHRHKHTIFMRRWRSLSLGYRSPFRRVDS